MNDNKWLGRMAVKIVLYYLGLSSIGIYISNRVLHHYIRDVEVFSRIATYAWWASIALTALFLYLLLKRYISMIKEREQQYQTLADSGQALVWLSGSDKLCTYFNKTWLEYTGRTQEQEIGNGWVESVHPEDLPRCLDIYTGSFERREKFSMDYRLRRHDGEYRWFQADGSPRYNSDGCFVGYIGFCLDVSEGKLLEAELAKNNEFMVTILDCLSDGVVACDKDGVVSLINRSAGKLHGIPEQPLPLEQLAEYYDLYEKDGISRIKTENIPLFRALQGQTVTDQEIVVAPKGAKPRTLLATGRPLVSRTGETLGAVVSLHDVSLVKALEEHIRQSQKLESIGTLAGGIAHDFNNILTVIIGASALLEMGASDDQEHMKLVAQIRSCAERAAKLTQSLLVFSRKQTINRQTEDLCGIVTTMQDFLGRIIGEDILLTTYLPDDPLLIMIDRGQIEQVLMNLAVNSRDAMPHGGVLNITVSRAEINFGLTELDSCLPGDYALITVSDTGEGMDKSTAQRIFEPFFTTKAIGKGTGLGLSMSYGIIRQHDGMIKVYSEPGEGTTFRIYLPLRDHQAITLSAKLAEQLPGGGETILLVEDDSGVLAINKDLLERAGYNVLCAQDGVKALELFEHGFDKIALVILDVIMPGMNGKDVYEKLKTYKHNVKVLFASGYTEEILNRKGIVQESNNFICKPLNPQLFLRRIRTLIGEADVDHA